MSDLSSPRLQDGDALVAEYLSRHPDFLQRHPEVLDRLQAPARWTGDRVVDMQQAMMERLRGEIDRLKGCTNALISTTRANMSILDRVHGCVLTLLEAGSLGRLAETVRDDLAALLAVDTVTIGFEQPGAPPQLILADVQSLPGGTVDRLLGTGRDVVLRAACRGEEEVYGGTAPLVQSDALVRLCPAGAPQGLLAIGSRRAGEFDPGQGTELLLFLARVLERCVAHWLKSAEW